MENKGPFYLTTAIAYTSGRPHIGNTYEIILSDAIARCSSRPEPMNTVSKLKKRRRKQVYPARNLSIPFRQRFAPTGI